MDVHHLEESQRLREEARRVREKARRVREESRMAREESQTIVLNSLKMIEVLAGA